MAPALPPPPEPSPHPSALTVLVVDGDPDMRAYVRQCLGFLGERLDQVIEATDDVDALRLIQRVPVDLVLCDMVLPERDGPAFYKALKEHAPAVLVVLISGEEEWGRLSHIGADAFLGKPFNAARLQSCLEKLLQLPHEAP